MLARHSIRLKNIQRFSYKNLHIPPRTFKSINMQNRSIKLSQRPFSNKISVTQWILDYEARMKQASKIDSSESSGKQFTNGVLFAILSASFLLGAIYHEYYQYSRFRKIMKSYFFKTGVIDVSNEKAKPIPEDFPIHKLYPQRVLIQLLVNSVKDSSKHSYSEDMWQKSKTLSQIYSPKIIIEQHADTSSEDEKIKFDYTYTIDPDTLIDYTIPPIVIGQTAEPTEKEIQIIKEKFKDWTLFYFNKENGFFYFIKNPSEEDKALTDIRDEKKFKKHAFGKEDIRVKVKIWDSDDYTIFGKTEDQKILPFHFKRSYPLLYVTKNRNIYIEDIKLKYYTEWTFYRIGLVFLSVACYAINQLCVWGASYSNYGLYRLGKIHL